MQEKNKKNNRAAISAEKKLSFKTNLNDYSKPVYNLALKENI
jgi:hypothetical protein